MGEENPVLDLVNKTRPTRWDRKILSLYKVYPSPNEIPEFVARSTITFYRNKFRIHYSIGTMVLLSFGFAGVAYIGNKHMEARNNLLYSDYQKEMMKKH